jgi:nicotinamidase-related amidase
MLPSLARLLPAARAAGVQVVHCTAYRRADGKGANTNARLFMGVRKSPVALLPGTPEVEVVPELGPAPADLVLSRTHGLDPMAGTDLDPVLRNLGVTTIVVTGVSVNVAVTNLVMDAVNRGYDVVLPRDAVCGIPRDYADAVIDNTLALLAAVTTTDDLVAIWEAR